MPKQKPKAKAPKPKPLARGWRVFNQGIEVEPSCAWRVDADGHFIVDGV